MKLGSGEDVGPPARCLKMTTWLPSLCKFAAQEIIAVAVPATCQGFVQAYYVPAPSSILCTLCSFHSILLTPLKRGGLPFAHEDLRAQSL